MNAVAFGQQGGGKTMCFVKEAFRYHIKHPTNKIYSNVPLNKEVFGDQFVPLKSMEDIFDVGKECFVLIDEAWHMADSSEMNSAENKALGILLIRSRKSHWMCCLTEQWYTQLIRRIRFAVDLWIMPQYYLSQKVLQEDIYDVFANYIATRFYDAVPFFKLYETDADPLTLNIEEVKEYYLARKRKELFRVR